MIAAAADQSQRIRTIALCFLVAIFEGYDIQAIGVAAPRLAPALGLSAGQLGLVFSVSNIGIVVGAGFGGWLADRLGRRPVLVAAVLAFGLFTLATLFVTGFGQLFAVRLLTGLGLGAALPNMMALAADISPTNMRNSAATMMFCGMPLGGAGSAWFISQLAPGDWSTVFLAGGAIPLATAPLLHFFLPNLRPFAATGGGSGANILRALFGERRAQPTFLLWAIFFPTLLILYLLLNWLPTLTTANGMDRGVAAQASLVFNLGGVVGGLALGRLLDRFSFRWPIVIAYAVLILSIFALSQAQVPLQVLIFAALTGFALLGAQYGLYGVAPSYYPRAVRGVGSGFVVAVGRLGSIIGPVLAGSWLSAGASPGEVIFAMMPVALCAGLAALLLSFFSYAAEGE